MDVIGSEDRINSRPSTNIPYFHSLDPSHQGGVVSPQSTVGESRSWTNRSLREISWSRSRRKCDVNCMDMSVPNEVWLVRCLERDGSPNGQVNGRNHQARSGCSLNCFGA